MLYRSDEDLPALNQDAERILNDGPTPGRLSFGTF